MKTLKNKIVVITGASSGIGRALAVLCAKHGAQLAISDLRMDDLNETVAMCKKGGASNVKGYELDVASRKAIYAHAEQVKKDFGNANVIINNAGVALAANVTEMKDEDLDWIMDIDFWGVANGTRAFLPQLIASGDGHVVNISSLFGLIAVPTQSAYNAAKFAVRGFTEALRQEMQLAGHKVGVSCIHPGGIKTNIANYARATNPAKHKKDAATFEKIAMTTPESAAKTIVNGILKDKARVIVGADAKAFDISNRLLGGLYHPIIKNTFGRAMK